MEKYRKFADHGTGIQPYLTPKPCFNILGIPLLFIKVPLLLVSAALLWLAEIIKVIPGMTFLVYKPTIRLVLLLLGYVSWEEKVWPLTAAGSEGVSLKKGDILMANLSSYVDVLVFGYLHAPTFLFASEEGVIKLGTISALKYVSSSCSSQADYFKSSSVMALDDAVASTSGPVVLFFEGTTTTGQGVLDPPSGLITLSIAKSSIFRIQTISYQRKSDPFTSCHSFSSHLLSLLTSYSTTFRLCTVTPKLCPQFASVPDPPLLTRSLLSRLAESSGIRTMSSNRDSKRGFMNHWESTQGVGYLKGSK